MVQKVLVASFVALFVGALLLLLWAIVRFGFVSARRTRGAAGRLRDPDPAAVERVVGFAPPPALAAFYRESDLAARTEVTLVDGAASPPARWFVGAFIPLAAPDVREWRAVSGVPGVPVATDGDKGTYYVAADGAVRLRSPDVPGGDVVVAAAAADFLRLPVEEEPAGRAAIECPDHGAAYATFVCRHLADGSGRGFVCFDDPDDPYPDAWCEACEATRARAGGWDEESERVAGITVRCHHCYRAIRERAAARPAT